MNYYRRAYPELNNLPDDVLREHCRRFAVEQGHSTCFYDRRELLQPALQNLIDEAHLKTLEISPWYNPFLRGDNVKYFGVENSEGLKKSAIECKLPIENIPEKMDFISSTGDLAVVNETFDIIFSSHVIEHCPDLVEHFQKVSKILNKGGLYILIVPDKRYCFDYYNSESTLSEVLDAFANKRKISRLADVINLNCMSTHNNAVLHWLGIHGERYGYKNMSPNFDVDFEREKLLLGMKNYSESLMQGKYIDTHNWRFTPDSFRYILDMLNKLRIIDLKIFRLCHTLWGRLEFIAMLEKI